MISARAHVYRTTTEEWKWSRPGLGGLPLLLERMPAVYLQEDALYVIALLCLGVAISGRPAEVLVPLMVEVMPVLEELHQGPAEIQSKKTSSRVRKLLQSKTSLPPHSLSTFPERA